MYKSIRQNMVEMLDLLYLDITKTLDSEFEILKREILAQFEERLNTFEKKMKTNLDIIENALK